MSSCGACTCGAAAARLLTSSLTSAQRGNEVVRSRCPRANRWGSGGGGLEGCEAPRASGVPGCQIGRKPFGAGTGPSRLNLGRRTECDTHSLKSDPRAALLRACHFWGVSACPVVQLISWTGSAGVSLSLCHRRPDVNTACWPSRYLPNLGSQESSREVGGETTTGIPQTLKHSNSRSPASPV